MKGFEAGGPQTRATVVLQGCRSLIAASITVAPFSSDRPRSKRERTRFAKGIYALEMRDAIRAMDAESHHVGLEDGED